MSKNKMIESMMMGFILLWGSLSCLYADESRVIYTTGFEAGMNGWYGEGYSRNYKKPGFWKQMPTVGIDPTTAAIGRQSVKIENPRGDCRILVYPFLSLKPYTKYTISCYVKTDIKTGNPHISLEFQIPADKDQNLPEVYTNLYITPTTEWKRYALPIELNVIPSNYIQRLRITARAFGEPRAFWIDGVQVEEGSSTDYQGDHRYEAGSILNNTRHHRYYLGEQPSAEVAVRGPISDEQVEINYRIEDYRKRVVKSGKQTIGVKDNYGKAPIDLFVKGKGYFHVFFSLLKDGVEKASWEEQFVVITPHRNTEFDDTSFWGNHISPHTANRGENDIHLRPNAIPPADWVDLAEDMGVKWIRGFTIGGWIHVQPGDKEGEYIFCDEWVDLLTRHKIRIMPVLGYQLRDSIPKWVPSERWVHEAGSSRGGYIPEAKAWEKYITTMVTHYKDKIKYWELMNEPNLEMVAEDYLILAQRTYEAAKKADPNCMIVGPASTYDLGGDAIGFLGDLLKLGGGQYLDVISFHFYGDMAAAVERCRRVKEIVSHDAKTTGKPVWSSEWGAMFTDEYYCRKTDKIDAAYFKEAKRVGAPWPLPDTVTTAGYMVQDHVTHLAEGTRKYFFHVLETFMSVDSGAGATLVRDGSPNERMPAYCQMVWMLDKAEFVQELDLGKHIRGYVFKVKDSFVTVLWTTNDEKGVIQLPDQDKWSRTLAWMGSLINHDRRLKFYDMMGNESKGGQIEISNSPVYLVGEKMNRKDYLESIAKLEIGGLTALKARIILTDNGQGPCLKAQLRNLFPNPARGTLDLTFLPSGISVVGGRREYPFAIERIGEVVIPVKIAGPAQGRLSGWIKAGASVQNIENDIVLSVSQKAKGSIRIDGSISEAEWHGAPPIAIDRDKQISAGEKGRWGGPEELSALVYSQWDEKNLYIGAKVKNRDMMVVGQEGGLYQASSIELFFDTAVETEMAEGKNANYTEHCLQIALAPATAAYPLRIEVNPNGRGKLVNKEKIEARSQEIEGGYSMEVRIPLEELGAERLSGGKVMGFNVSVNDAEKTDGKIRRKHQMTWNGKDRVCSDRTPRVTSGYIQTGIIPRYGPLIVQG